MEFVLDGRSWFGDDADFEPSHVVRVAHERFRFSHTAVVGCLASELRYVHDFHHQWPGYWLCPLAYQMDFVVDQQHGIDWHNDGEFSPPVHVSQKRYGGFPPRSGGSFVELVLHELDNFHHHGSSTWAFQLDIGVA